MQVLILLITLILFITSSISFALTPLVGEDNFEVVCQKIEKIQIQSNKITKTPWENDRQNERFNLYFSKLIDLAFSSETRITFDADDIDNLLTVMEDYLFLLNDQPKSLFISWLEEDFSKLNKKYGSSPLC